MKKVAMFLCAAALLMTACAPKNTVGDSRITDFRESIEPSPTVTKTSARPKQTETEKPSEEPTKSRYKPDTYRIKIFNQYEQYQPNERVVRQGDILIFTNNDPNYDHSLTEGAQKKKNPVFDSGTVKKGGGTWRWVVDAPPGEYMYHCELVPYMQTAGPIKVLDNPQL